MSIRSNRRLTKQLQDKNFDLASPTFFELGNIPPSSNKKIKSFKNKKIRKTNELFYFNFDTSEEQENIASNNVSSKVKTQSPTVSVRNLSSYKNINKSKSQHELVCIDLVSSEQPQNSDKVKDEKEGRKIVKAKRLLRNNNCVTDYNLKLEYEVSSQNYVSEDLNSFLHENINMNKSGVDDQEYQANCAGSTETDFKERESTVNNNLNLLVTTLPSPISPSENSTKNKLVSTSEQSYLSFDCSEKDLHPSTSGSVTDLSDKRRTYELENSVIDVSILKSESERDSNRVNSASSEPTETKTPTYLTFSKVTTRRRWDKINNDSSYLLNSSNSTPITVTKSPPKTATKTSTPMFMRKSNGINKELSERQDSKQSKFKKSASKIKIPNFAAIHEKALSKIESISEYKKRKEDRAKMLLSGKKPTVVTSTKKESRKQLRFAPDTSNKEKSMTFIPLPSTPLPKRAASGHSDSPLGMMKSEYGKIETNWLKDSKTNIGLKQSKQKIQEDKKIIPSKILSSRNNNVFSFQYAYNLKAEKPNICQNNEIKTKKPDIFKNNEIKSIITKSKPVKSTVESRRGAIKGVRSNRRFELLMNMRKGK